MDIGLEQNGTWNSYILHASAVSWDIFRHTQVADIAHWAPVACAVDTDIWHHDTHLFCDAGLQRLLAAWAARAQVSPDSGSRRDYPHEMAASSHSVSLIKTQLSLCFMLRLVINFLKDKRFLAPSRSSSLCLSVQSNHSSSLCPGSSSYWTLRSEAEPNIHRPVILLCLCL